MKVTINKSELKGRVRIPPSKSHTIRGLMCAALAEGESQIVHPLLSDDTEAAADVLGKVGVDIQREDDLWRISGGHLHQPDADLYCGDSAATLRFMTAICSIIPGKSRLTAGSSLSQRPIGPLIRALKKLGVDCSSESGLPPVTVAGGRLKGRETEIPGNISSQYISALLMISPFAAKGVEIRLTKLLESKPYVMMTLICLKKFGIEVVKALDRFVVDRQVYRPARYEIEGDWSSASYFLALGATSGELEIENLNSASWQGDRMILNLLREMGVKIKFLSYDWDGIIPALLSKKADMLAADMTATLKRAMKISFVDPYMYMGSVVFVKQDSPIKTVEDVKKAGIKIAVLLGSTGENDAKKAFPEAKLKTYKGGGPLLINALLAGHTEAGVNDGSAVRGGLASFPPNSVRILEGQLSESPLSFAVRYDSPDLKDWLNLFFLHISLDGRLKENLDYWVNSMDWKKDH